MTSRQCSQQTDAHFRKKNWTGGTRKKGNGTKRSKITTMWVRIYRVGAASSVSLDDVAAPVRTWLAPAIKKLISTALTS